MIKQQDTYKEHIYLNSEWKVINFRGNYNSIDEFIDRILHDKPYDEYDNRVNSSLRNPIINWFNDHEVDFENIYIDGVKSIENFYLIPMVLYLYRLHIAELQSK